MAVEVGTRAGVTEAGAGNVAPGGVEVARAPSVGAEKERSSGGIGLFFGRLASVFGLLAAAVGLIGLDVSPETVGIALGVTGYALGARGLGIATVTVSTILLVVVLAVGVGEVPGIAPTDPIVTAPGS